MWVLGWCSGLLSNDSFSFFGKFIVAVLLGGKREDLCDRKVENHWNQRLAETCANSTDDTEIIMDEQKKD